MDIVYNETFEGPGSAQGPFRVFVATNVMARLLGFSDDLFDTVYYFGKVTDEEDLETRLYAPYPMGNADIAVSRVSLSMEQDLRIQTGESFRRWRAGEQDLEDYPAIGYAAMYFKRRDNAFWAYMLNGLGMPAKASGSYQFVDQSQDNGITSIKMYAWKTLAHLAHHTDVFTQPHSDPNRELGVVDLPGLLGMRSEAYTN